MVFVLICSQVNGENVNNCNKLVLHPNFEKIIKELGEKSIFLPRKGDESNPHTISNQLPGQLITNLEEITSYKLDALKGCQNVTKYLYSAYDESIKKYSALEGSAYFTTHSLVIAGKGEYIPVVLAVFNFYTRAANILSKSSYIKFADDPEVEAQRDHMRDKVAFLLEYTPPKSLLFIDGPLIGGDLYTIMLDSSAKFLEKEIMPIYFVKNSTSSIVSDNIAELKGKYNSDMHWLHGMLKPGERSSFFKYEDQINKKNSKVFCYLKAFNSSPQRIEMHVDTFKQYETAIPDLMDIVAYLLYVQGSKSNPQLRPIAIAEKYARSVLNFIDINQYFKQARITPTLNQERFWR